MTLARNRIPAPTPIPTTQDAPLTTGEAAHMLDASQRHVTQLADRKVFRSWRIGTHRRIDFADFVAWAGRRGILLRPRPPRVTRPRKKGDAC